MARAFWQHKTSGDTYAVETLEDGTARYAFGPVYHGHVTAEWLEELDFGGEDEELDAAYLNNQAVRLVEPDRYYQGD